jgi:hypothetical protein
VRGDRVAVREHEHALHESRHAGERLAFTTLASAWSAPPLWSNTRSLKINSSPIENRYFLDSGLLTGERGALSMILNVPR